MVGERESGMRSALRGVWPTGHRQRRRRRRWVLRAGGVLLLGSVGLGLAGVWQPLDSCLRIRKLQVVIAGPGVVDTDSLSARLPIAVGDSFLRLRPGALAAGVRRDPRIAAVQTRYRWFHELVIEVLEREAVGMIIRPDGGLLEVASDGTLLAVAGMTPADLPLVSWEGQEPRAPLTPGARLDLRGAPDLCQLLPRIRDQSPLLWRGISEARLLADGTCEFYWSDAPIVAWSRGPLSDMRVLAWAAVMSDLARRGERDAVVDLRYREQIIVRLPDDQSAVVSHG